MLNAPLQRLNLWLYRRRPPYSLALVRMTLPLVLLIDVLPRWFHIREIYSSDGSTAPFWETYGHVDLLPILPPPAAVAVHSALIFFLITGGLGWKTGISWFAVALLYPYFGLIDAISTMTKYTVLGTHLALLLSLSRCGAVWSVDAWLAGRRGGGVSLPPNVRPERAAAWPQRLIQLLIGCVYLGAAATKLHTPAYFNGDQLSYWMLTTATFPTPLGDVLSQHPALLVVFSYVTILWEVLFIFLVWGGYGRIAVLSLGIVFHAMTWLTLGLIVFPLIYVSAYFAFLRDDEARQVGCWFRSAWNRVGGRRFASRPMRLPLPAPSRPAVGDGGRGTGGGLPTFLFLLMLGSTVAVTAEARMDVYEKHGPEGPIALQPLPDERVAELLRNDLSIRPADKVFSFNIGTTLIGDVLADRQKRFRHGDRLLAQCRLIQPHEDLWVEVNLHDAHNRLIERNGQVASREDWRATFYYQMRPSLEPGEYDLVLKLGSREVGRRRVLLEGR